MDDFAEMFPIGEPEPERDPEPDYTSPVWFGPPADELGTCLPASRVVGRSDNGAIALRSIVVYTTGLNLDLVAVARGISGSRAATFFHGIHGFELEDEISDAFIRVGLEYDDGSRVSNISGVRRMWQTKKEPDGPVLVQHGGGGGQAGGGRVQVDATHWLWPLPPAAPLSLFVAWPAVDIGLSSTQLDGHAITEAAAKSQSLWP